MEELFIDDIGLLPGRASVDANEVIKTLETSRIGARVDVEANRDLIVSIVDRMNHGDLIHDIAESDGATPVQFLENTNHVVGATGVIGDTIDALEHDELAQLADRRSDRHKAWPAHSKRYEVYMTVAAAVDVLRIAPEGPVRRVVRKRAA